MISFKPTIKPRFIKIKNTDWRPRIINTIECPTCGLEEIKKGRGWIGRCISCSHIHNFLYPTPTQAIITQLRAKVLNLFGGTGSGKTTASALIISEEMRNNPGVKVMAFAQTSDQLKQTGKEELGKMFMNDEWVVKNDSTWKHRNGSKITWYTSDSEQKVRGANIGIAWLLESSGIPHEIFKQLMTRTRQDEMKIFNRDENGDIVFELDSKSDNYIASIKLEKGMLLNETNPTHEWPRDKALFKSHTVIYTPSVRGIESIVPFVEPESDPENPDTVLHMISILFASVDNPMMTREYLSTIRMTYDDENEYNRDIYCDMSFASGLIYGQYVKNLFKPIKETWVDGKKIYWFEGMDPGGAGEGNDETGYGLFRVTMPNSNTELPLVELVDGYKKSGLSTHEEAINMWKIRKKYNWNSNDNYTSVVDPSGVKVEKKTRSNLIKDLMPFDIYLTKDKVNTDVDFGIKRVKMFMDKGKLIINNNEFGEQVKDEISTYIWTKNKTRSSVTGKINVKPIERNNHLMDMIRFVITVIPIRQDALSVYDGNNRITVGDMRKKDYSATSYDYFARQYEVMTGDVNVTEQKAQDNSKGIYAPDEYY